MSFSSRDANGPGPLLPHSRPGVGQDWFAVQSPDKSGLPFAIRGVGADRSTFPSVVRGAPGVASFSHCAATGTDTGAMATDHVHSAPLPVLERLRHVDDYPIAANTAIFSLVNGVLLRPLAPRSPHTVLSAASV